MTVKELIEKLTQMPQDAVIEVPNWYEGDNTDANHVLLRDDGVAVSIIP